MATDLNAALNQSAAGPRSFSVDGQSTVEHSLPDQIAAAKFQAANRARSLGGPLAGVTLNKLRPHGAVLSHGCFGGRGFGGWW